MWHFPSIQAFINDNALQIIWTFGALFFCFYAWFSFFYKVVEETKERVKNVIIGSVTFLLIIFSSCGVIVKYNETRICRNLNLDKVTGLSVKRLDKEDTTTDSAIVLNDAALIRAGMTALQRSSYRPRNKDRFVKGFRLQLILADGSNEHIYLDYFPETEKGKKNDIVIPHCQAEQNGFNFDGVGIYSSTAFGDWIRENVETKFKNNLEFKLNEISDFSIYSITGV